MFSKKICSSILISGISFNLGGCSLFFSSHQNPLTIAEITNYKEDRKLYIAGEVIRTIYLVNNGAYLVRDNTDEIWILTNTKLPSIGDKISIKGQITSQELPFEEEELYLQQLEIKPYSVKKK